MVLLDTYNAGSRKPNHALLWEYDMDTFDWQKSKVLVVQRVVEMGEPFDEIDFNESVIMTTAKFDWKRYAERLNDMVHNCDKVFADEP